MCCRRSGRSGKLGRRCLAGTLIAWLWSAARGSSAGGLGRRRLLRRRRAGGTGARCSAGTGASPWLRETLALPPQRDNPWQRPCLPGKAAGEASPLPLQHDGARTPVGSPLPAPLALPAAPGTRLRHGSCFRRPPRPAPALGSSRGCRASAGLRVLRVGSDARRRAAVRSPFPCPRAVPILGRTGGDGTAPRGQPPAVLLARGLSELPAVTAAQREAAVPCPLLSLWKPQGRSGVSSRARADLQRLHEAPGAGSVLPPEHTAAAGPFRPWPRGCWTKAASPPPRLLPRRLDSPACVTGRSVRSYLGAACASLTPCHPRPGTAVTREPLLILPILRQPDELLIRLKSRCRFHSLLSSSRCLFPPAVELLIPPQNSSGGARPSCPRADAAFQGAVGTDLFCKAEPSLLLNERYSPRNGSHIGGGGRLEGLSIFSFQQECVCFIPTTPALRVEGTYFQKPKGPSYCGVCLASCRCPPRRGPQRHPLVYSQRATATAGGQGQSGALAAAACPGRNAKAEGGTSAESRRWVSMNKVCTAAAPPPSCCEMGREAHPRG